MKNPIKEAARGRPMDQKVHQAILEAAISLLEAQGVDKLTIKGIAEAAGVTRPAIYRRWSTPIEIALDAFLETTGREIPIDTSGNPADALVAHILAMTRFMRGRHGRIVVELLGAAQCDQEALSLFRVRFLDQRRMLGRKLFDVGIEEGIYDKNLDIELAIDLYAGPIYHRALTNHKTLTDEFAHSLAKHILRAVLIP